MRGERHRFDVSSTRWRALGTAILLALGACAKVDATSPARDASADADAVLDRPSIDGLHDVLVASDLSFPSGQDAAVLTDFPSEPILDGDDVPKEAPSFFAKSPRAGEAPCITEPRVGTLLPRNWLRPLFAFRPASTDNLFELRLSAAGFAHPLRVYTRRPRHVLARELWDRLRSSLVDREILVEVRSLETTAAGTAKTAPSAAGSSSFSIAPVAAPGAVVYWAVTEKQGSLKGFSVGDETVRDVLTVGQVEAKTSTEVCIGCHASTPDGLSVGFALGMGFYYDSIADISAGRVGRVPAYVTSSALKAVRSLLGVPAYSPGHWSAGDRITVLADDLGRLHFVQLDGERQGVVALEGETRQAAEPAFRRDGTALVYVANDFFTIGRADVGPTDLMVVPYNDGAGGKVRPLAGAAYAAYAEFYPAYSPDDQLIAFTRVGRNDNLYANPKAEIAVAVEGEAVAHRLEANDAPSCMSELESPGLTNDWPKWSPEVVAEGSRRFYWLAFSSTRSGIAQIYLTAIVREGGQPLRSTPAVWFWNQGQESGNHTPAWDVFRIPTPG